MAGILCLICLGYFGGGGPFISRISIQLISIKKVLVLFWGWELESLCFTLKWWYSSSCLRHRDSCMYWNIYIIYINNYIWISRQAGFKETNQKTRPNVMKSMEKTSATKILEDSGNVFKKNIRPKTINFYGFKKKNSPFCGRVFFLCCLIFPRFFCYPGMFQTWRCCFFYCHGS